MNFPLSEPELMQIERQTEDVKTLVGEYRKLWRALVNIRDALPTQAMLDEGDELDTMAVYTEFDETVREEIKDIF